MVRRFATSKSAKSAAGRKKTAKKTAKRPAKRPAKKAATRATSKAAKKSPAAKTVGRRMGAKAPSPAKKRPAKKASARKAPAKKAPARKAPAKKAGGTTVSRSLEGRLALPGPARHDLAFDELRDRLLIELAALAESDRAGDRPYKMVLVVKRGKTTPLSYKLVVERSG